MINDFGLHDATLVAVDFTWADGTCVMRIEHTQLSDARLTFTGVSHLRLSRTQPWGRSVSINSALERSNGQYEIEMQSGDVFEIHAVDVRLSQGPAPN